MIISAHVFSVLSFLVFIFTIDIIYTQVSCKSIAFCFIATASILLDIKVQKLRKTTKCKAIKKYILPTRC